MENTYNLIDLCKQINHTEAHITISNSLTAFDVVVLHFYFLLLGGAEKKTPLFLLSGWHSKKLQILLMK